MLGNGWAYMILGNSKESVDYYRVLCFLHQVLAGHGVAPRGLSGSLFLRFWLTGLSLHRLHNYLLGYGCPRRRSDGQFLRRSGCGESPRTGRVMWNAFWLGFHSAAFG